MQHPRIEGKWRRNTAQRLTRQPICHQFYTKVFPKQQPTKTPVPVGWRSAVSEATGKSLSPYGIRRPRKQSLMKTKLPSWGATMDEWCYWFRDRKESWQRIKVIIDRSGEKLNQWYNSTICIQSRELSSWSLLMHSCSWTLFPSLFPVSRAIHAVDFVHHWRYFCFLQGGGGFVFIKAGLRGSCMLLTLR